MSWFISNSYSKSEIARRPLTIAFAPLRACELDQQVGNDLDLDVREVRGGGVEEVATLLRGEQRLLLAHRVVDDADDDLVEDPRGAADDVEVAVGDRVVAARADRDRAAHDWPP